MKLISLLFLSASALALGGETAAIPDYSHIKPRRNSIDSILGANSHCNISGPHSWSGARPDGHAPIGVMGDHTHGAGGWMLSYRYMFMSMRDNYSGSSKVSDASVVSPAGLDFAVTPTEMDMHMHMVGLMYAPTDRLTMMAMVNFLELSMQHLTRMGGTFETESSGLGDTTLSALYRFRDGHGARAHAGLGLILPTADIENTDATPLGVARLPYPMQSGSGNWGIEPSLTYLAQNEWYSWGAQAKARLYFGDNSENYRLGNRLELTTWAARRLNDWASLSLRLSGSTWGNIAGADPAIATTNPMGVNLVPTAFPNLRGGSKVDAAVGMNIKLGNTGGRLGIEVGAPLWQDLDGPQLGTDWWLTTGVQYAF